MKRSLGLGFLVVPLLFGCGAANDLVGSAPSQAKSPDTPMSTPSLSSGRLAIRIDGNVIQVGEEAEKALELVPSSKKSINVDSLPQKLTTPPYTAKGWQSPDGKLGLGLICVGKNIALAIYRLAQKDTASADDVLADYKKQYGEGQTVNGAGNTYTFWEDGDNRLMLLEAPDKRSPVQLTIAVGNAAVCDALRMDPADAQTDLAKLQAGSPPNTDSPTTQAPATPPPATSGKPLDSRSAIPSDQTAATGESKAPVNP